MEITILILLAVLEFHLKESSKSCVTYITLTLVTFYIKLNYFVPGCAISRSSD